MAATIQIADFVYSDGSFIQVATPDMSDIERGNIPIYDPTSDLYKNGFLRCAHPNCSALLNFMPSSERLLGSSKRGRVSYFYRKAGEQHNREGGCVYPNTVAEEKAIKKLSRSREAFLAARGHHYIYLNLQDSEGNFDLNSKYKAQYQKKRGHLTVKQSDDDATMSVHNAHDFVKLARTLDFDHEFYNGVFVVSDDFTVPFNLFFDRNYGALFSRAYSNSRNNYSQAFLTPVRPILASTSINRQAANGLYRVSCQPQFIKGRRTNQTYAVTPTILTSDIKVVEAFHDSAEHLIWANRIYIDRVWADALMRGIEKGALPVNDVPLYMHVNRPDQVDVWTYPEKQPGLDFIKE